MPLYKLSPLISNLLFHTKYAKNTLSENRLHSDTECSSPFPVHAEIHFSNSYRSGKNVFVFSLYFFYNYRSKYNLQQVLLVSYIRP